MFDIVDLLGCSKVDIIKASAKTGDGIGEILEAIIERVPPPKTDESNDLKALIFAITPCKSKKKLKICYIL